MWTWIKGLFASRYIKSAVRYVIAIAIGALAGQEIPGLADLAEFLKEHSETLANIIALILTGVLGSWSVAKNRENSKIDGTK
jgi:hypothetical protein